MFTKPYKKRTATELAEYRKKHRMSDTTKVGGYYRVVVDGQPELNCTVYAANENIAIATFALTHNLDELLISADHKRYWPNN